MSDIDDAVADMMADMIDGNGESFTYERKSTGETGSATAIVRSQLPILIDTDGHITEVRPVDFIMSTDDVPLVTAAVGDRYTVGSEVYEVNSLQGEKCYRQVSPSMTRVHTKRIT